MKKTILAALGALAAICAPVMAQSNTLGGSSQGGSQQQSPVVTSFSMSRTVQVLQTQGLITEILTAPSGAKLIGVSVPGGGRFLIQPRDCQDSVNLAGCKFIEFIAQFQASNIPYEQMNEFHLKDSRGSYAARLPTMSVIGNRAYAPAGVREDHILLKTAIFLVDAQNFAQIAAGAGRSREVNAEGSFPELMDYAALENGENDGDLFPEVYHPDYFARPGARFLTKEFEKILVATDAQ